MGIIRRTDLHQGTILAQTQQLPQAK